jgi:DNA-binding MarR family transcriptional regulator
MRVFERMRALRAFENQHLLFLKTGGHHHLISEIGHQQALGKPLTLKQLFMLDIGSVATIQRHLSKLKELGLVQHQRVADDRRAVELTLTPKCLRIFAKYDTLMASKPPVRDATQGSGERSRLFGLYDSESGNQRLIVSFLTQGFKLGSKCLLVAPAAAQIRILEELNDRRKGPRQLIVSQGYETVDAHVAFLKRVMLEAKRAGQSMRLAADVSWTLSRNVPFDVLLEIVRRFDVMTTKMPVTTLRVFDVRHFSSEDILRAARCYRDHSRYSIVVG